MNILIIEDEQPASERMVAMVQEFDATIHILATLRGVQESIDWMKHHPAPDLIIVDIQLNDGISLEIFKQYPVASPLIFTTAYDEYLLKAFEFNSIDYLLKPIQKEKLHSALAKYFKLKQHFTGNLAALFEQLQSATKQQMRRLVVKKGTDFVSIKTDEIAYFYTEHKIVFLVDNNGRRYIVDQPLADLEMQLDDKTFFRINRKFLTHINSIVKFKPYQKGKLLVELKPPTVEDVIISQENASIFKQWIGT